MTLLVARRALLLHLRAQAREVRVPDGGDLRLGDSLGEANVDDVATLEVDTEVEAPEKNREDARDDHRERSGEEPVAVLDDVEAAARRMLREFLVDLGVEARVAADLPAQHPREHRPGDRDRGEEGHDDADRKGDRES